MFIVCTPPHPPFSAGEGEVEPPTKFSKRGEGGGLTESQFLEGSLLGKQRWLILEGGGCSFYLKNKLKSEIFKDEKSM